jgi:hypothetical protein
MRGDWHSANATVRPPGLPDWPGCHMRATNCCVMMPRLPRLPTSFPAFTVFFVGFGKAVVGGSHYGRPEAMAWCERQRIGYIFGLAGNPVLLRQAAPLAEDAAR